MNEVTDFGSTQRIVQKEPRLLRVEYFVEATQFERQVLCAMYTGQLVYTGPACSRLNETIVKVANWQSAADGSIFCFKYKGCQASVELVFSELDKHVVCFYNSEASTVRWGAIEKWLRHHFPLVPKTDADGFGAVAEFVRAANSKQQPIK